MEDRQDQQLETRFGEVAFPPRLNIGFVSLVCSTVWIAQGS
jgi:hypothetical protein